LLAGRRAFLTYRASKFAVVGMVQALARELAGRGVRVAAVAPGLVDTEMLGSFYGGRASARGATAAVVEREALAGLPAGRAAEPEEVADAFVFLASPLASYVSGIALAIDGGELSG
jgi:NAD(P)-dependent dehydrogenase (short-subunit alcohol dehydrogenase family)